MVLFKALGAISSNVDLINEDEAEKIVGADVYINFSNAENLTNDMLMSLAYNPIIMNIDPYGNNNLAMLPLSLRSEDAIVFTAGKSISSLIIPYMTRAVLETEAREINLPMKIAAAKALDELKKDR